MFFRTDMAVERRDLYRSANKLEDEINGIECEVDKTGDTTVTRVKITNHEGEKALDRKMGNYITIDMKKINNITTEKEEEIINVFSKELSAIVNKHVQSNEEILIVGLGRLYRRSLDIPTDEGAAHTRYDTRDNRCREVCAAAPADTRECGAYRRISRYPAHKASSGCIAAFQEYSGFPSHSYRDAQGR